MGRRGPAPRSPKLRVVHDDPKHRSPEVVTLPPKAPPAPPFLPPEGRQVWDEVVEDLDRGGVLVRVDGPSLEAYVMAVVMHRKASRKLIKEGPVVKGYRGSKVKNPALQVQRDQAATIRAFAREFGLTPAARVNLPAPEPADDEDDDLLTPRRGSPQK